MHPNLNQHKEIECITIHIFKKTLINFLGLMIQMNLSQLELNKREDEMNSRIMKNNNINSRGYKMIQIIKRT